MKSRFARLSHFVLFFLLSCMSWTAFQEFFYEYTKQIKGNQNEKEAA